MPTVLENSIKQTTAGNYEFWFAALDGRIERSQPRYNVGQRIGIDGNFIVDSGERGIPFDMMGTNFLETFQQAEEVLDRYNESARLESVTLTRDGVNYGTFCILQVREAEPPAPCTSTCGALPDDVIVHITTGTNDVSPTPPFMVCHRTVWTLLAS